MQGKDSLKSTYGSIEQMQQRKEQLREVITLEDVYKSYAVGAPALNGISLHIGQGEFVFVVGDSGSGKSTLIKLLLRELKATKGEINVLGYDLKESGVREKAYVPVLLEIAEACEGDEARDPYSPEPDGGTAVAHPGRARDSAQEAAFFSR